MPKTATPRKPETVSRKLAETRNTSKNRSLSSLLGIGDNEKRLATDIGSGLNDVIGRGTIAGLLGLPGDIGGAAENGLRSLLGLPQVVPYGGSEHIGQKMEQAGLVSDVRRPKTELLASLISPAQAAMAGYKAPQMARAGVKALDNLASAPTMARMGQRGAIDPDLLKQLVSDASKYESANDYRKAYVAEHLMDLSNPQNHRIGRLIEDGVDEDTMRYMDAKYTADMYGRRGNNEYKYQREAMVPDVNTPDDMVTIYRGTDPAQKDMIPGDFVSFNRDYAAGHGDNVLSMRVPARDVVFQGNDFHEWIYSPEKLRGDKYEGGLDKVWEMSRNGQPVGNLGKMVAPQDEALRVAQANAAKPVSEGGLGLRPDNTPEERAAAMGFTTEGYHGTNADVPEFDMGRVGTSTVLPYDAPRGVYFAKDPELAGRYSRGSSDNANIIPALLNSDGELLNNSKIIVNGKPSSIRSRFAAFDPMRRDSSDLLAGIAPLGLGALIAQPKDKKKKKPKL